MLYNFEGEYCYEDASVRLKLFHRIVSYLTDINMYFMTVTQAGSLDLSHSLPG